MVDFGFYRIIHKNRIENSYNMHKNRKETCGKRFPVIFFEKGMVERNGGTL